MLSESSSAHSFFFACLFVWKWQIHFFSSFYIFFTFLSKISKFLQIWKIKMQIIATCSIWQQPSLVLTPQPWFSAPFLAAQTNCLGRQWSQQVIKRVGEPHSLSVFETLESFVTFSLICCPFQVRDQWECMQMVSLISSMLAMRGRWCRQRTFFLIAI